MTPFASAFDGVVPLVEPGAVISTLGHAIRRDEGGGKNLLRFRELAIGFFDFQCCHSHGEHTTFKERFSNGISGFAGKSLPHSKEFNNWVTSKLDTGRSTK